MKKVKEMKTEQIGFRVKPSTKNHIIEIVEYLNKKGVYNVNATHVLEGMLAWVASNPSLRRGFAEQMKKNLN